MGIGGSARAGISGKSLLGSIPGGAGDALGLSLCSWDIWSKHKASKEQQRLENVSFPALCPDRLSLGQNRSSGGGRSCGTAVPGMAESAP